MRGCSGSIALVQMMLWRVGDDIHRATIYRLENILVTVTAFATLTFGVATVVAFFSDAAEAWRAAKWSLQIGVICAVVMVVLNIVLRG